MAENYKLVSEDEWQAMVDRAEVAEGWSEHWRERAERAEKSKRQLATLLDEKADREEPVKWVEGAKTETVSRYDTDGRLIYQGPIEDAPAFGESETTSASVGNPGIFMHQWSDNLGGDSGRWNVPSPFGVCRPEVPQRPHESLVWAIYHVAAWVQPVSSLDNWRSPSDLADSLLAAWRARWPESTD